MWICNHLRRMALRRAASKLPTAILPLSLIRSATVLLDASESSFEECERRIRAYFSQLRIQVKIIHIYLEKLDKDAAAPVDGTQALLLRDLDWCGRPSASKIRSLDLSATDLFISLCGDSYPVEFISSCIPARFKIGRFPLAVFDVVLDGRQGQTQEEVFLSITELFTKIK
ncbi:MAG: hypothetical protein Q4B16_06965 [Bacteroidia bacterium]|nr:hypothetical protein [Bacteroidia bacterium]